MDAVVLKLCCPPPPPPPAFHTHTTTPHPPLTPPSASAAAPSAGTYNEVALKALDQILADAADRGLRLVLILARNWGGPDSRAAVGAREGGPAGKLLLLAICLLLLLCVLYGRLAALPGVSLPSRAPSNKPFITR